MTTPMTHSPAKVEVMGAEGTSGNETRLPLVRPAPWAVKAVGNHRASVIDRPDSPALIAAAAGRRVVGSSCQSTAR